MRRGWRRVAAGLAVALSVTAAATAAGADTAAIPLPVLEFATKDVHVTPRALPAHERAPIAFGGEGRVSTRDGSHPAALREAVVEIDRDVQIDVEGLPACGLRRIAAREPAAARRVCGAAIVGGGDAVVLLSYPENTPIRIPTDLTIFNAGVRDGVARLLIHGFVTVPIPHAVIARVELRRDADGVHGWRAEIEVPQLGDGYGSLLEFRLRSRRLFVTEGRKESFLSASCRDGQHLLDAAVTFRDEVGTPGEAKSTVFQGRLKGRCSQL